MDFRPVSYQGASILAVAGENSSRHSWTAARHKAAEHSGSAPARPGPGEPLPVPISRRKPPDARADPGRRIRKVLTRLKGKSQKKGGPRCFVGPGGGGVGAW